MEMDRAWLWFSWCRGLGHVHGTLVLEQVHIVEYLEGSIVKIQLKLTKNNGQKNAFLCFTISV
jgi:hypothetical protein